MSFIKQFFLPVRLSCLWSGLARLAADSLLIFSIVGASISFAQTSGPADFSDKYGQIYQIRLVSPDAGAKSSIGSGFQVSSDGLLITNFHVISDYVDAPETYEILYTSNDQSQGKLELLDFDVVSDLALLRIPNPSENYFSLTGAEPRKGEEVFALGNPGDWGVVMVPGPSNGYVAHSYEKRILFSGSLNGGMSGGPSFSLLVNIKMSSPYRSSTGSELELPHC